MWEEIACVLSHFSPVWLFVTPQRLQPARLPCPWDSPGRSTGLGCRVLLLGISPTQGLHLQFLHWQGILHHKHHLGSPLSAWLSCSVVSDSATAQTVARQAPLSMGILQARILEWVAFPFSRGSSQARDQTQSLAFQADFLPAEPPGKPRKRMDYLIIWCYWWIHNWWILWREYNRTPILCHIQT